MRSLLVALLLSASFVSQSQGLSLVPGKKQICRKKFLAGAAGAAVLGTATAAGAAVAATTNTNQQGSGSKKIYEPAAGSLDGKIVLITGASTGLGLESAKRLAAAGATIVLTSRNQAKGEKAVASVEEYIREQGSEPKKVYNLVLDLDDLASVKAFPGSYKALGLGDISVLMNNAGVMAIPERQVTKDGYERTFQSNHLGHFVLTAGLFPYLSRQGSTVINVSSEAYNFASQTTESGGGRGLDMKNLNADIQYGPWSSYGLSKLANILFTQELQRKADASGNEWLTTVCLHPGAVSTDLGRNMMGEEKWNEMKEGKSVNPLTMLALKAASNFILTVPEGASTQVFLAAGADGSMSKGAFYEDLKENTNLPGFARDTAKAKALWEESEKLGGVTFDPASIKAESGADKSA